MNTHDRGVQHSPISSPSTTRSSTPTQTHPATPKSVQFNENPVASELSADESYTSAHHDDGSKKRRRRRDDHNQHRPSARSRSRSYSPHSHSDSEDSESDATVDLPPRFDEHGRQIHSRGNSPEKDPLVQAVEGLFQSDFLKSLTGEFTGKAGSSSGRRRRS